MSVTLAKEVSTRQLEATEQPPKLPSWLCALGGVSILFATGGVAVELRDAKASDKLPCEETQELTMPIYADLPDGEIPVIIQSTGDSYLAAAFDTDSGFDIFSAKPISPKVQLDEDNDYSTSFALLQRNQTLFLKVNENGTVTTHC